MRSWPLLVAIVTAGVVGELPNAAQGGFIVDVNIVDPSNTYSAYYAALTSHALAAGQAWGQHFAGSTSLQLDILFDDNYPRATGRSTVGSFVDYRNGFYVWEQGVGAEIRTGVDPNGSGSDLIFTFNSNYLQNELWFDPDPYQRTATIPSQKTDAMSVFLHEYAHALAFNGWQHHLDGTYPGDYRSTFDEQKSFDGTNFFFHGTSAMALYGGPVPITYGNVTHLGNNSPRPGSDLIPDLMNGVVFTWSTRYDISPLDLAIISDTGLGVISTPEPSTGTLLLLAGAAYGCGVRLRNRRCRAG